MHGRSSGRSSDQALTALLARLGAPLHHNSREIGKKLTLSPVQVAVRHETLSKEKAVKCILKPWRDDELLAYIVQERAGISDTLKQKKVFAEPTTRAATAAPLPNRDAAALGCVARNQ